MYLSGQKETHVSTATKPAGVGLPTDSAHLDGIGLAHLYMSQPSKGSVAKTALAGLSMLHTLFVLMALCSVEFMDTLVSWAQEDSLTPTILLVSNHTCPSQGQVNTHTQNTQHAYTYTPTHLCPYTHTPIYTLHKNIYTHLCNTPMHKHLYSHTYTHTYEHTHTPTHTYAHTPTPTPTLHTPGNGDLNLFIPKSSRLPDCIDSCPVRQSLLLMPLI